MTSWLGRGQVMYVWLGDNGKWAVAGCSLGFSFSSPLYFSAGQFMFSASSFVIWFLVVENILMGRPSYTIQSTRPTAQQLLIESETAQNALSNPTRTRLINEWNSLLSKKKMNEILEKRFAKIIPPYTWQTSSWRTLTGMGRAPQQQVHWWHHAYTFAGRLGTRDSSSTSGKAEVGTGGDHREGGEAPQAHGAARVAAGAYARVHIQLIFTWHICF